MNFTKPKFKRFPVTQQHKKCAELLKKIHEELVEGKKNEELLSFYYEMTSWMQEPVSKIVSIKEVCNLYHYHLAKAKFHVNEPDYLPTITISDRITTKRPNLPIQIYLDHLRSAHNVGSIIRTVEAFGLGTLYFSELTPTIENDQVRKTSMGAYEWVTCHSDITLESLPRPVICLETSKDAISLYDFIFPEVFTLVVGNEEYGCSDKALKLADYIIEIPLCGRKNSLNVANAFAIAAGEIIRQKGPI